MKTLKFFSATALAAVLFTACGDLFGGNDDKLAAAAAGTYECAVFAQNSDEPIWGSYVSNGRVSTNGGSLGSVLNGGWLIVSANPNDKKSILIQFSIGGKTGTITGKNIKSAVLINPNNEFNFDIPQQSFLGFEITGYDACADGDGVTSQGYGGIDTVSDFITGKTTEQPTLAFGFTYKDKNGNSVYRYVYAWGTEKEFDGFDGL